MAILETEGEKMDLLPRYEEAVIPIEKFTKYALSPTNSKGKWVAFKEALGYDVNNAEMLIANIRENIMFFTAVRKGNKGYGETYAVLMELTGVNGKTANVMTAWLEDNVTGGLRLTSVYIKRKKG